jgi:hypothetical protein
MTTKSVTKYYVLNYDQTKAFETEFGALDYDCLFNPELHSTADKSMDRLENILETKDYEELSQVQKDYLFYQTSYEDSDYE